MPRTGRERLMQPSATLPGELVEGLIGVAPGPAVVALGQIILVPAVGDRGSRAVRGNQVSPAISAPPRETLWKDRLGLFAISRKVGRFGRASVITSSSRAPSSARAPERRPSSRSMLPRRRSARSLMSRSPYLSALSARSYSPMVTLKREIGIGAAIAAVKVLAARTAPAMNGKISIRTSKNQGISAAWIR